MFPSLFKSDLSDKNKPTFKKEMRAVHLARVQIKEAAISVKNKVKGKLKRESTELA